MTKEKCSAPSMRICCGYKCLRNRKENEEVWFYGRFARLVRARVSLQGRGCDKEGGDKVKSPSNQFERNCSRVLGVRSAAESIRAFITPAPGMFSRYHS